MRHDCLPTFLSDRDKWSEIVSGVEKLFSTGPTRAAKVEKKSLLLAQRAQRTYQGKAPLICTPWVPICLSFHHKQGPPLSSLSDYCLYVALGVQYNPIVFCLSDSSRNNRNTIGSAHAPLLFLFHTQCFLGIERGDTLQLFHPWCASYIG
jgi:hypothetical protein